MDSIELSIVKGLIYNEEYARRVYPYLKPEYFDGESREIFNLYADLFDKYNKIPSMESLLVSLQKKNLPEDLFEGSVDMLKTAHESREEPVNTEWLVDETESYCSDKALFNAIYRSISIIEGNDKKLDKHAIPTILDEALSIDFCPTIGSDYLEDFERRYAYYTNTEARLRFPLEVLNTLTNGGLPPKTLNAFLAGSNVGKSAMMCFLAGEWLKLGKNVLYITLEMSEEAVQERIDANLMNVKTDDLKKPDLDKSWFESKIAKLKAATLGKLIVKEYPTSSAHAGHFRHLLKDLKQKKKFVPDVIFIDYINICASSRFKAGAGANSYTIVKSIAEELRGLAVEFEVPVVTATQTTREGMNSQSPDMTSTSESIGLPQTLDWFCAIVTNEELAELGRQVLIPLKTRYGNKQGIKPQLVKIDWDYMRYEDVIDDGGQRADTTSSRRQDGPPVINKGKPMVRGIPDDIKWDE